MRVCFLNRSYWPDLGATGQLLTELAEDLANVHGWSVSVVAGRPLRGGRDARRWPPTRRESQNGVEIFRAAGTTFSTQRFAGRAANYMTYFGCALLAGFRIPRPDVVVALTDPPIIGLVGWLLARRARAPFVFLCEDVFPEVAVLLEDFRSATVNHVLDRMSRFIVRKAGRVVALGETMRRCLIEAKGADPDKVAVIHNWADCSRLAPAPKDNEFSRAHGLLGKFVVMHSGNVGLSQNLDVLLDAASRLRAQGDILFVIIGDGAKRPALEARARSEALTNVRFLPYQPREALTTSFASADTFIVSLKTGLAGCIVPSKLYGILAGGRPYVASVEEDCEVAAITREHDCGLLAQPGNAEDLAAKILLLYRDRSLTRRLGENARRAALEFDRPRQVNLYHELLREVVRAAARRKREGRAKRAFDVGLSAVGLVLSAPLWPLIAALIKLDDGGPVFYAQARVGKGGRRFKGWKFRSMIPTSDTTFGPLQAKDSDARITRIGRLLRATAMDELPQLWNIFRGDMSFVGPRALMPEEIEVTSAGQAVPIEKIPGYEARHRVTPGLTGVAQIYADRDIARRHKFRYDLLYIRKQSVWLDLRLIALSFWITFRGRWEHRGGKF